MLNRQRDQFSNQQEGALNLEKSSFEVKVGLAGMLKGGVIIDVTTPDEARLAEDSGVLAVMALERSPQEIMAEGGVARMANPELIQKIQEAVSIPVMAMCRPGHFVEAQILEALFLDFIDESELLSFVDEENLIDKHSFRIPFVCGASNLGEALRRIGEGAALIRTKGECSTGNILEAVSEMRCIRREIHSLSAMDNAELMTVAKQLGAPYHLVQKVAATSKLPVPLFAFGGITTPADAALMMQLGAESVFINADIFRFEDAIKRIKAIVGAVANFDAPETLVKVATGLAGSVPGAAGRFIGKEDW